MQFCSRSTFQDDEDGSQAYSSVSCYKIHRTLATKPLEKKLIWDAVRTIEFNQK